MKSVHSAPAASVTVGSQRWRDESLRSIQRAQRLVLQSHLDTLHSATRYRRAPISRKATDEENESLEQIRPKSTGTTVKITNVQFYTNHVSLIFPNI